MKKQKIKSIRAAVIYTRVSSKHQVEGTSLASQEKTCVDFCAQNNLQVEKIFIEEGESAKFIERTELMKLLKYCAENKDKISHMVIYKFDRFARNAEDHIWLRKTLIGMGITVKSATEQTDDSAAGMLQEGILSIFNEYDNRLRGERCIRGTQEKMRNGIWCRKAPIGYMPAKKLGAKEKKMIADIPDPEKFELVKEGWDMYLTGHFTMVDIAKRLSDKGLRMASGKKIYPQIVQHIFNNKYYCGLLIDPWTQEEYFGLHKPMITREEFDQAQRIMKGRGIKSTPKSKANPDFPLTQFVKCGVCAQAFTGSWSTSRNKEKHAYYRCARSGCNGENRNIKKITLEDSFMERLAEITPKKEFLSDFKFAVTRVWEEKYKTVNAEYIKFEKQLERHKKYKALLVEKNMKGVLPDEEFAEELAKIKLEIEMTELAMHESRLDMFELEATLDYCNQFIHDLPRQWFDLGVESKKRFQRLIFPEGLTYIGNERFGTAKMSVIFEINQQYQNGKTSIVGPAGIEPATKRL